MLGLIGGSSLIMTYNMQIELDLQGQNVFHNHPELL